MWSELFVCGQAIGTLRLADRKQDVVPRCDRAGPAENSDLSVPGSARERLIEAQDHGGRF